MSPSLPPLVLCKALWGSRWFRVRGACRGHYLSRGGQRVPSLTAKWLQFWKNSPPEWIRRRLRHPTARDASFDGVKLIASSCRSSIPDSLALPSTTPESESHVTCERVVIVTRLRMVGRTKGGRPHRVCRSTLRGRPTGGPTALASSYIVDAAKVGRISCFYGKSFMQTRSGQERRTTLSPNPECMMMPCPPS